jgi:hypothetical protein
VRYRDCPVSELGGPGTGFGEAVAALGFGMLVLGGFEFVEPGQQLAIGLAGVVGGLPEALVGSAAALLDVGDGRPVADRGLGKLGLGESRGLPEHGESITESAAQLGDDFWFSRHVNHASTGRPE